MAEITIRLVFDTETGKKDIWIDYESDDDAMPIEHERAHRDIVEALLGKGVLRPEEVGRVKVGRKQPDCENAPVADGVGTPEPEAVREG